MALGACLMACLAVATEPVDAVFIGHSLQSDLPDMTAALAGGRLRFREQNIPGAPLKWQWEEAERGAQRFEPRFQGVYTQILGAGTEVLVMVDSVPRGEEPSLQTSIEYASRFVAFARRANPGVRVFYMEPWHHLTSGTAQRYEHDRHSPSAGLRWRPRLTADRPKWDRVVAEVNRRQPGAVPVRLLPAGSGLGVLADAIEAGQVPGLSSVQGVFDDEIHLNPLGKYFLACLHFRAIFGESPVGKPYEIRGRWGKPYWDERDWAGKLWPKPKAETVRAVQEVAARVSLP